MKRFCAAFLLLCILLISGCEAPSAAPTPAPQSPAPAASEASVSVSDPAGVPDRAEPEAIDDSIRTSLPEPLDCGCESIHSHLEDHLLPEVLDRYFEGAEILDREVWSCSSNEMTKSSGWICFTGTPRQELGWRQAEFEGTPAWCRGFTLTIDRDGTLSAGRSIPMEPVHFLDPSLRDETGAFLGMDYSLPEFASAELYVPQLGETYFLTDPEALSSLHQALSPQKEDLRPSPVDPFGVEFFLPLYLHYPDGSSSLVQCAGDGANLAISGIGMDGSFGSQSLFRRFGVPLEARGYSEAPDGSVTVEETVESYDPWMEQSIHHEYRDHYNARGQLVLSEHFFARGDESPVNSTKSFTYREDGQIEAIDTVEANSDGIEHRSRTTYSYGGSGLLLRRTLEDLDTPGQGCYHEFRYDEQDRLTAVIYHYLDGREGLPSGNAYFWYDEQGRQRAYQVDDQGNLTGGPEGDDTDRPLRR